MQYKFILSMSKVHFLSYTTDQISETSEIGYSRGKIGRIEFWNEQGVY